VPHELGSSHSVRRFDLVGFDLKRPESSPRRPLHSYRTALVRPVFLAKDFQYRIKSLFLSRHLDFLVGVPSPQDQPGSVLLLSFASFCLVVLKRIDLPIW
jgi:hypothetical protein